MFYILQILKLKDKSIRSQYFKIKKEYKLKFFFNFQEENGDKSLLIRKLFIIMKKLSFKFHSEKKHKLRNLKIFK